MQPCLVLALPALSVSGQGLVVRTIAPATSLSAPNARLTPTSSLRFRTASGSRLAKRPSQPTRPRSRRIPDRRLRATAKRRSVAVSWRRHPCLRAQVVGGFDLDGACGTRQCRSLLGMLRSDARLVVAESGSAPNPLDSQAEASTAHRVDCCGRPALRVLPIL